MKKNVLKTFLAMITVCSVIFVGCASSEDDSTPSVNYGASGSGSVPEFVANSVIKNKVVNINGSTDVYYEYLTFTTDSAGTYSVYKDIDGTLTKQESITFGDVVVNFPTEFTFDKATGKFTAGETSTYMVNAKKSGKEVYAIAGEILTTSSENKSSLMIEWVSASGECFNFMADGTVAFTDAIGEKVTLAFANKDGWILIAESVPLLWAKQGEVYNLYYPIYETERTTVDAEGRMAVAEDSVDLVSNRFLLVR